MKVVDSDTHLYEPRDMWSRFIDPSRRHLALSIEEDDLGHPWLVHAGRRVHLVEIHHPGRVDQMGRYREAVRRGQPRDVPYDEELPRHFWDPGARRDQLDDLGLDEAVVFPNFGLLWERALAGDLDATRANMEAWNRWAAEVGGTGRGRLHPVAHLSLRDPDWLEAELARLEGEAIRLAMIAPALVDGKPPSHPDLDRCWAAFVDHGITPVFHVAAFPHPFADAWYEQDPDEVAPVLSSVFIWSAPALALADMAVNGVFARHPDLRLGVMELSAVWVPMFLMMLDGGYAFHERFNGKALTELELAPSEYVKRQVRVAAFGYERPDKLIPKVGDLFMFCSDYPHAEGLAQPRADYQRLCGPVGGDAADRLYSDNLGWLLGAA